MNNFVNLHGHSEYSSLDGFSQIKKLVQAVKENEQPAIALTDHGNLNGAYKFYQECIKNGIKPILGNEMYLTESYDKSEKYYHGTILSYNNSGWANLLKLHKISFLNKYYKPRISFKDLFAHKEGLIILSGCPSGVLSRHIKNENIDKAVENLKLFLAEFGDNFYIEIMDHALDFQKQINDTLRELAIQYNIKKVATTDYHYPKKEDYIYQDYLVCDQLKTDIYDTTRVMKLDKPEFYLKKRGEVSATEDELDCTLEIADRCNVEIKNNGWLLPQIENQEEILVKLINDGFEHRKLPRDEIHLSRLREEYQTITEANLTGYLLTVQDYIAYAKSQDILVGPGRGSVGGSLIGYLIGIHDVNPIKHNLLFSRFYNAGRSHSLPDIDIDFPENDIQKVRSYIYEKYGKEKVAHIGASTFLQPKGAMKLLCRVLNIDFQTSNRYSNTIEDVSASKLLALNDPIYADIVEKAKHFEGLAYSSSIHAAGMIISPVELETLVPLRINDSNGFYVSGWDMKDVESVGLVKYDFLSLSTLDVIQETLRRVNLKISDIPTDDARTFELINTTNNIGIFQLSSDGISKLANDVKVHSIDDIAAVVALYRPGPMGSGLHTKYVARKHGQEPIIYEHPLLESVLKHTYGLLIFQEQITKAAMVLANFSEREADDIRKAMGKKIPELMKQQKTKFAEGCLKNNIESGLANKIWDEIEKFAGYSFNTAHAVEYGYITYYTSYLKAHYPHEFMASLLNQNYSKNDKLRTYLEECQCMGIEVLPPSVKNGGYDFTIKDNRIVFGLKGVSGMGEKTAKAIYENAYVDFEDFCRKYNPSKDTIVILAESGALDDFNYSRNAYIIASENIGDKIKNSKINKKARTLFEEQTQFIENIEELPDTILASKEYSRLNTYLIYNPLKDIDLVTPEELLGDVFIEGFVSKIDTRLTKKKNTIAIVHLSTKLGNIEILVFAKLLSMKRDILQEHSYIAVEGTYEDKLIARKIWRKNV